MRGLVALVALAACGTDSELQHGALVDGTFDITFVRQTEAQPARPALVASDRVAITADSLSWTVTGCDDCTFVMPLVDRDALCARVDAMATTPAFSVCGLEGGGIAADLLFADGDRWCMFGAR